MSLLKLKAMCGTYPTAQHMRNNGYPLYMTLWLLARKPSNKTTWGIK